VPSPNHPSEHVTVGYRSSCWRSRNNAADRDVAPCRTIPRARHSEFRLTPTGSNYDAGTSAVGALSALTTAGCQLPTSTVRSALRRYLSDGLQGDDRRVWGNCVPSGSSPWRPSLHSPASPAMPAPDNSRRPLSSRGTRLCAVRPIVRPFGAPPRLRGQERPAGVPARLVGRDHGHIASGIGSA
jgi:hypothetical protein